MGPEDHEAAGEDRRSDRGQYRHEHPVAALGQPRGRTNSPGKVSLPEGWLASRDDDTVPEGAEMDDSGG